MKIVEIVRLIDKGDVEHTDIWKKSWLDIKKSIEQTDWPHGSGSFKIPSGRHQNGVKPIKIPCIQILQECGWKTEDLPQELAGVQMGNLDAMLTQGSFSVGFEWETGNISSSHRAIGKLIHAIMKGGLVAGVLVLPSRALYPYLTDRIGNIEELRPYFPVWEKVQICNKGLLKIVAIEHDDLDDSVEAIPKGTDGRAKK